VEKEIKRFNFPLYLVYGASFLVGIIVFVIIGKLDLLLGFILGGVVTFLAELMHSLSTSFVANKDVRTIWKVLTSYPLRMILIALALFICYKFGHIFNFMASAITLVAYNFLFLIYSICFASVDNKKKEEGSEIKGNEY